MRMTFSLWHEHRLLHFGLVNAGNEEAKVMDETGASKKKDPEKADTAEEKKKKSRPKNLSKRKSLTGKSKPMMKPRNYMI